MYFHFHMILLVLSLQFPLWECEPTMVLFWGSLNVGNKCSIRFSNLSSFENCWRSCQQTDSCIVAYQETPKVCLNCKWLEVKNITVLEYNNNASKVALKVNATACSAENVSTFSNGKGFKVVSYNASNVYEYSIGVIDNILVLNTTVRDICGGIAVLMHRATGWRCFMIWALRQNYPYRETVRHCNITNRVLTALESSEELKILTSYVHGNTNETIAIRVNGLKRTECRNSTDAPCRGLNAYTFNDTTLKTFGGMKFMTNLTGVDYGPCEFADCLQAVYFGRNDSRNGQIIESWYELCQFEIHLSHELSMILRKF